MVEWVPCTQLNIRTLLKLWCLSIGFRRWTENCEHYIQLNEIWKEVSNNNKTLLEY